MNFSLNQYNHAKESITNIETNDFIENISQGNGIMVAGSTDDGVISHSITPFYDAGFSPVNNFLSTECYYFHGLVKRLPSDQIFYIKLASTEDTKKRQFLKKVVIQGGPSNDWIDVDIIFKPVSNFNIIFFELERTPADYAISGGRTPAIIFYEIDRIKNFITSKIGNVSLYKMGIRSNPGLLMCINNEEIRVGKSGIYEIRNGLININFFSIVGSTTDTSKGLENAKAKGTTQFILNSGRTWTFNAFTLDYVYKEG